MLDRRRSKVPKHDWRKFFERLLQLCADGSRSGYYWNWRWSKLPQKLTIVSQMDVWSSILFLVSFESPILKFQRCRSCSYESSPSKVEGVWKPMTQWQPLKTRREESRRNSQQVIFSGLRLASDLGATIGYRLSLVLRHTHILNLFRCRMHTDTCISISIYIYTLYTCSCCRKYGSSFAHSINFGWRTNSSWMCFVPWHVPHRKLTYHFKKRLFSIGNYIFELPTIDFWGLC